MDVDNRPVSDEPLISLSQWKLQLLHGSPFVSSPSKWCMTTPALARFDEACASRNRALSVAARSAGFMRGIGILGGGGGGDGVSMTYVSWCVSPTHFSLQTSRRKPHILTGSSHATVINVTQTASQSAVARQRALHPLTPPTLANVASSEMDTAPFHGP
jgi:hypothetical protein